jgi:predicted Zn-dependent peptidase
VQDVSDFFRMYYAPNNAVLTLVGDFNPDEAMVKVTKYFGQIPSQPSPPIVLLDEEPHYGERREIIYDPLARSPQLDIAYHIAPGNTPANYAMQQLAIILGQGESSRFYQHLVKAKQLASKVSVRADTRIGVSQLYISASPRPGVEVGDLEKGIDEEIAEVKLGVTPVELAKAQAQLLRQFIERRRPDLSTAIMIGNYTVTFDDPNLINTLLEKEQSVTLEQVNTAATQFLVRDERTVVTTLPTEGEASKTTRLEH